MSTQDEIILIFYFILHQLCAVGSNEIIISLCADSRHTFLFHFAQMASDRFQMINILLYAMIDGIIIQLFSFLTN